MAALKGAVALEEMHDIAFLVSEDLNLDVSRAADILLDQDAVVTEGGRCLAAAGRKRFSEVFGAVHTAHTFPSAASDSLDQYRVASAIRFCLQACF